MWQGGFTPFLTSVDDSWSLIQDTALDRPPYVLTLKVIRCVRTIGFPTRLLKTATSFNSPVCSSFSYCELNTANWILSDNQEINVIVVLFLPLTKVRVVMSTTSVLQDEQLHFSFTIEQNIQCYPNITKAALVRQRSPVVTGFKNAFKAPDTGKSYLKIHWSCRDEENELIRCTASSEHILPQPAYTSKQLLTPVTQCKQ